MTLTLVLTIAMVRWAGLALFLLSILALIKGDLPDHGGYGWANALRMIVWPLMFFWFAFFFFRGLIL